MSKMLDKVSKLLAKAENAGTPEEAETFMAKAMEMAAANAIDLAVARMHQAKKERIQEPEERRVSVNPPSRRHNRKHFVELAGAIAEVNDCEYLIGGNDQALFVVGFPSDLDVVEALFTHLSVEMVSECDRALKKGENKEVRAIKVTTREEIPWEDREWGRWNGKQYYDENPDDEAYTWRRDEDTDESFAAREAAAIEEARKEYLEAVANGTRLYSSQARNFEGGYRKPVPPPAYREVPVLDDNGDPIYEDKEVSTVDGRVFRNEFYEAFVSRIRRRLWEVKRQAQKDAGEQVKDSDSVALALRDKKEEVKKAHDEQRSKVFKLGTYTSAAESSRKRDHSGLGYSHGAKAADAAPLGSSGRGVESS